ncbi:hypothetical protein MLD38_033492 [Melastoma candidum]|uniref:Uncharacterized protein n=1 Tax=Melastoma candidum TaxID=119954 RepID=A0ACB9M8S2_9MYRT|nr:hypothetical protein MLD38_033492 [Melastoma candidum]
MPHCEVGKNNKINIFYRTYGGGPVKVLLIIGLAGTHDSWLPQVKGLTGTEHPNDGALVIGNDLGNGIEVCAFDNRGVGRSSVPTKKSSYSTKRMAKDAIAVLDHLGWKEAHVFGHSMGGMIACKVAALVPNRVRSLALLNVTGGGYQCIPRIDRKTLSVALRFVRAKTPEERAAVDLDTHFSEEYLGERVGAITRRVLLYQEYVKAISSSGMQSPHGLDGQLHACWHHKVTEEDIDSMRSAGFLVSVIHGRHDIIAQIRHARALAERLHPFSRMVDLPGGHLIIRERMEEVNQALLDLVRASEMKTSPQDWTNLSMRPTSGWIRTRLSLKANTEGENQESSKKLQTSQSRTSTDVGDSVDPLLDRVA